MPTEPAILTQLRRHSAFWRRRRLSVLLLTGALCFVVPLLLIALIDMVWPLRESSAAWLTGLSLVGAIGWLIVRWLQLRRHLPDARRVALAIESDSPAYMDSLACAVELLEQPAEARQSALHQALLAKVSRDLAHEDIGAVVRRRTVSSARLGALAAVAVAMLVAILLLPLTAKTLSQGRDLLAGENTGLIIEPGDFEIASGDNLTIRATVLRGQVSATLQMEDADGSQSYSLYPETGNTLSMDLYAVDRDFTYRVVTPTLRSRAYHVRTFRRPEIESLVLHLTPPAYTGLQPSSTPQLTDLSAPVGSTIHFRFTANMPVKAVLRPKSGPPIAFRQDGSGRTYAATFELERSLEYQVELDDLRGHVVTVPGTYRLDAIADGAPVVQIHSPEEDAVYDTDEIVPFAIDAADDYALREIRLHYSINGGDFKEVVLYRAAEGERRHEASASHGLPLDGIVEHGDVIYYYGVALDNREPQANEGRTDIRFIEIRPRRADEPASDEQMEGGGGQEMLSLSVSDLIVAQKDLIRQTWRHEQTTDAASRERLLKELTISSADLRLNASKRYNDIKERAQGLPLGKIGSLFEGALASMESAMTLLQNGDPRTSLPFQQSSLSRLIQLEIELLKNAQQQQQGQGQSSEQQAQRQQNQDGGEQDQDQKREEQMAGLQQTLQKLQDLAQRQQNLNTGMSQNAVDGKFQAGTREGAINEQRDILADTWDARNELAQMREAQEVLQEVTKATQQMTATRQSIGLNNADRAIRQGKLAEDFLRRSQDLLEKLISDLSGNELQMVERQLAQLRERQERVRQETEKSSRGEAGAPSSEQLGKAQESLRDDYGKIMSEIGTTASEMESQNPVAARTLANAMQSAREANIDGRMQRAENALRYSRAERAVDFQKEVEAALAQLAQQLGEASDQAGGPGREQLARMLEKTLEDLARMQRLAEQRADLGAMEAQADQMRKHTQEMAKAMKDGRMDHLANQMNSLGQEGAFSHQSVQRAMNLSAQAARLLELKIMEKELERRVEFSRLAGRQPPEEYRKLVNEYFKKLSEDY